MDVCAYLAARKEDDVLVDLREKRLYDFGTIPGAIHIPIENIRQLYGLPRARDVYVFCQAGEISGEIAELLSDAGYNACNLTGGYREYLRHKIAEDHTMQEGQNHADQ